MLCDAGERRSACRVLVGESEGKRPLGRPRRRWEEDIKIYLQLIAVDMDWLDLAKDSDKWRALVNTVGTDWLDQSKDSDKWRALVNTVGTDWLDLAKDSDKWRALVNTVGTLHVPQNGNHLTRQETFCFVNKTNLEHNFSCMFISILYMFRAAMYTPIIRRNYCINATPGICHSVWMTVWYAGWDETYLIPSCIPDGHPHRVTNSRCRTGTIISPDDGHIVARNMWRLINILRINCAPSWFYLQDYTRMHGQQNIE